MNCEQARNLFDAHLDGELSSSLETELGAHRLQCPECRHQLAIMEVVGHVVAADESSEPVLDDAFADRLIACLDQKRYRFGRLWTRPIRIGAAVLATAAVVALTITVGLNRREPRVLGTKHIKPAPPAKLDVAAESLVRQVESTWSQRADNAQDLIEFGEMTIMQVLDRLGIDDAVEPAKPFELIPESFDELAPNAAEKDIEDL